jgi:hypothetical protein
MYVRNGEWFDINVAQVIDNIQYGPNWFKEEGALEGLGIEPVLFKIPPAVSSNQKAIHSGFKKDKDGNWVNEWQIVSKAQTEIDDENEVHDQAVEAVWSRIKEERDRRKFAGVFVAGHWFHSDTFSRTQWLGMLLMGANLPVYKWSTLDNNEVNTTPTLAQQVAAAIAAQDNVLFQVTRTKKLELINSSNPSTYNHMTGWPVSYGE